ncbi:class I adenylate-forming enzyme family protein [Sorangium sp. So ce281]|uniref:class I adenylate-forming enzyme family protein n=1 Tax=unclassified Sorangium TaxID=2621164 RepID=UPI003F5E1AF1
MNADRLPLGGPVAWLDHWGRERPDATAILDAGGRQWSYREVLSAVRCRTAWLVRRGLTPGSVVCISVADPAEQRLLRWAVNVGGGLDALQDPALAEAELAGRIDLLRPAVVVRDPLPSWTDEQAGSLEQASAFRPTATTPTRILLTTGSTGWPKAVVQLAGHLDCAALANTRARGLRGDDVVLTALPPYHAAGSLFEDSLLQLGGALALTARKGPGWFLAALEQQPATVTTVIPSMLQPLLASPSGIEALNRLRVLNYAGESIPMPLLERLLQVYRGQVYRGYGLTEAGPMISFLGDEDHRRAAPDPCNIGRPALGVEVRIDAAEGDESGELLVRSGHVMAGYLHDPKATAERLRDGWLRTGDLARWVDGQLYLTGRLGSRMRSGAEWIDPGEVERCLLALAGVEEVAVVPVASPRWGERPVAFIRASAPLERDRVREHLESRLVRFKWPDWLEVLSELPRIGPGKLDRVALRQRAATGPGRGALILAADESWAASTP